jgi:hypothetical protein
MHILFEAVDADSAVSMFCWDETLNELLFYTCL